MTSDPAAGDYTCQCCRMDRDGMLCCHILKVFTYLGIDEIPAQYILRRWKPKAIPSAPPTNDGWPGELPAQSKEELRHANLSLDFASLARVASALDAASDIVRRHMRVARTEIKHLNLSRKNKPTTGPSAPQWSTPE